MMGRMPDITPLIYFAYVGAASTAIVVIGGGGWLLYHLVKAIAAYTGVTH